MEEKKFCIDGCDFGRREIECSRRGDKEGSWACKQELFKTIRESGMDHCPCPEACPHHGNCYECVTLHRAHQDHLPYCMWPIVNNKLDAISAITEGSFVKTRYESKGE